MSRPAGRPSPAALAVWLGLWRTPLRRSVDRWEIAARWLTIVVLLVAFPFVVGVASSVETELSAATESRRATTATLLEDAVVFGAASPITAPTSIRARAIWMSAAGYRVEGSVRLDSFADKGDRVRVWLAADGRPAPPPPGSGEVALISALMALLIAGGLLLAAVLWLMLVHRALDASRQRYWDAAWVVFNEFGTRPRP